MSHHSHHSHHSRRGHDGQQGQPGGEGTGLATAGGSDPGAVAAAVLVAGEGITGPWAFAPPGPPPLPLAATANLGEWAASVRRPVIDWQLRAGLDFAVAGGVAVLSAGGAEVFRCGRPAPAVFEAQMDLIRAYADLRADRLPEILAQTSDLLSFFAPVLNLKPERHRYTLEFVDAMLDVVTACHMQFKHALACMRPVLYSPQVQPVIPTPGHGSLPSGHAAEAHAIAEVLAVVAGAAPPVAAMLHRMAGRIAVNRTVAGVHFPVDSAAGATLGVTLARHILARARGQTLAGGGNGAAGGGFDVALAGAGDFVPAEFHATFVAPGADPLAGPAAGTGPLAIPVLAGALALPDTAPGWLMGRALAEWA